jgi:hypothetical protein
MNETRIARHGQDRFPDRERTRLSAGWLLDGPLDVLIAGTATAWYAAPAAACSGPGAAEFMARNALRGTLLWVVALLAVGFVWWKRFRGPRGVRLAMTACLMLHPGWWMSVTSGDCGLTKVEVGFAVTCTTLVLLAVHEWLRRKRGGPSTRSPVPDTDLAPMAAALAPWRAQNTRPAWKPSTVTAPLGTRSWFGGAPLMVPNEPWPACSKCQHPMQFLLQLDLSTLPNRRQLPAREGLIQLFYCSRSSGSCDEWDAFSGAQLARLLPGPLQQASGQAQVPPLPQAWIARWDELADLPSHEDHGAAGLAVTYDFKARLMSIAAPEFGVHFERVPLDVDCTRITGDAATGDKLGGWPHWIQGNEYPLCPTCGTQMVLVFQLDSEDNLPIMFGDTGIGHITQCPEHPEVLAFAWACS